MSKKYDIMRRNFIYSVYGYTNKYSLKQIIKLLPSYLEEKISIIIHFTKYNDFIYFTSYT